MRGAKRTRKEGRPGKGGGKARRNCCLTRSAEWHFAGAGQGRGLYAPRGPAGAAQEPDGGSQSSPRVSKLGMGSPSISGRSPGRRRRRFFRFVMLPPGCLLLALPVGLRQGRRSACARGGPARRRAGEGGLCCGEGSGGEARRHDGSSPRGRRVTGSQPCPASPGCGWGLLIPP